MPSRPLRGEDRPKAGHHDSESGGSPAGAADALRWEPSAGCAQCSIRQQTLFAALRDSDLEHLRGSICSAVIPVGTVLYQEDEPAAAVYTLGYGLIKLIKHSPAGERIVRLLGPGAAAGLEAYFGGHYRHTAVAMRPSELCRIPMELLRELKHHNGGLADQVLAQWEQQLESADRWLAELSQGTVPERVQRLVWILAEMGADARHLVELPPMADLASILGSSRESVSRALSGLERAKTLRRVAARTYAFERERRHH
jgi:CRP-like cAMP-binding protein